ncbi:hypothetical protein HBI56_118270 [Parastagonospora nodorum]|uniref:Uncharacterized protein n=1 Tax=Phaeosphaeria nodorum (strain SN15 / ATCC MYA-4574 / FGSC 10173) TaxID=321614 RepID=A0A7U2I759_PHANO|nr:hypothetical protein HBH56_056500 [Parastagonospora nodorum]QRD02482.1 hypothetical protein JI435_418090 [Parastagonospora nodorum SN15]KAH3921097.1 hypothetical protein HBH54_245750 [Parastagonospora nodorum]KAH3948636.1 hypothetical protein HBH53_097020 [Parastagonospora nodorum]KAH3956419.1 hypothetical protein HBH51_242150 [Parastagonospora nodorum]
MPCMNGYQSMLTSLGNRPGQIAGSKPCCAMRQHATAIAFEHERLTFVIREQGRAYSVVVMRELKTAALPIPQAS